jgi:hypothetical protein
MITGNEDIRKELKIPAINKIIHVMDKFWKYQTMYYVRDYSITDL